MIALLTDFGLRDTYVGQMKAVIAGLAPGVAVVDLTHAVAPQNVAAGALALDVALPACPRGTVVLAVVDPGVGTGRRGVAIRSDAGDLTFVGPDNGLFTLALRRAGTCRAVELTNRAYYRTGGEGMSPTFHGRDIFAPVAAHLATGVALDALGPAVDDLVELPLPEPARIAPGELELHVLDVDRFGNLITDLTAEALAAAGGAIAIDLAGCRITRLARTYADVSEGEPVAYVGSSGRLEVALRNGSAAQWFNIGPGAAIRASFAADD
ncbi:MAG: SAM-dependent chlorinase/fluorinase [Phycisphaeraceae bacterium]